MAAMATTILGAGLAECELDMRAESFSTQRKANTWLATDAGYWGFKGVPGATIDGPETDANAEHDPGKGAKDEDKDRRD
jgi:hypothetical protein